MPTGTRRACVVMCAIAVALGYQIAVRQQHGPAVALGPQRDAVPRHHIGAVRKKRNTTEAFGFTLRVEVSIGHIKAA